MLFGCKAADNTGPKFPHGVSSEQSYEHTPEQGHVRGQRFGQQWPVKLHTDQHLGGYDCRHYPSLLSKSFAVPRITNLRY